MVKEGRKGIYIHTCVCASRSTEIVSWSNKKFKTKIHLEAWGADVCGHVAVTVTVDDT